MLDSFEKFVWQEIASQCAEQPPLLSADFAFDLIVRAEEKFKAYGNHGTERMLRFSTPANLDPRIRNALAAKDFAIDELKQSEAELNMEIKIWDH